MKNPIPLYNKMTSSFYIEEKILMHKVTSDKFWGYDDYVLVIGINRYNLLAKKVIY